MDEKAKEIWERLETEIAALKEKLSSLEAEVALYRTASEAEAPVDLSDVVELPDLPEEPAEAEETPVDISAPAEVPVEAPVELPDLPDLPVAAEETPPSVAEAAESPVGAPAAEQPPRRELRRPSGEYRWQKDRPGAPVKNIRSGISLYDRALFINTLFHEDFSLYDETVAALNACGSFDEAVDYLLGAFPGWDYASGEVYTFMMAIRKRFS